MSAVTIVSPRSAIAAATARLREAGVETPRVDAEWLLAGLLGLGRASLMANLGRELPSALASRYEARLQRLYDRAYKTLRELQQIRKSQEPTQPQNIQIRWVNPNRPSVSEGAEAEELPKEPLRTRRPHRQLTKVLLVMVRLSLI